VGWAAGAIAVGAPISPTVVVASLPGWAAVADTATAQLGVAVLVSSVAASVCCAVAARLGRRHQAATPAGGGSAPVGPQVVMPR
jgi:hypothetical protein